MQKTTAIIAKLKSALVWLKRANKTETTQLNELKVACVALLRSSPQRYQFPGSRTKWRRLLRQNKLTAEGRKAFAALVELTIADLEARITFEPEMPMPWQLESYKSKVFSCSTCGQEFAAGRVAKFCSPACKQAKFRAA